MDSFRDFSERHLSELRTASFLAFTMGVCTSIYLRRPQMIKRFTSASSLLALGRPLTFKGKVLSIGRPTAESSRDFSAASGEGLELAQESLQEIGQQADQSTLSIYHLPSLRPSPSSSFIKEDCLQINLAGVQLNIEGHRFVKSQVEGKLVKFVPLAVNSELSVVEADVLLKRRIFYSSISRHLILQGLASKTVVPSQGFQPLYNLESYDALLASAEAKAAKQARSRVRRVVRWLCRRRQQ
jgi:hypothetical protein